MCEKCRDWLKGNTRLNRAMLEDPATFQRTLDAIELEATTFTDKEMNVVANAAQHIRDAMGCNEEAAVITAYTIRVTANQLPI